MSTIHSPADERCGTPTDKGSVADDAQHDDALTLAASTWAVRQHSGLDSEGQINLQEWIAADPRHAAALAACSATLQRVRHLPAQATAKLRSDLPASTPKASWWRSRFRQFAPHAVIALCVLVVINIGWFGWWTQPTFDQAYATARGQQIVATLPDDATAGSTIHLDTATHLHVRLFHNRREVALNDGQAMFLVHGDKSRPFHVVVGGLKVTVVGTRFSVRHTASGVDAGHTVVAVEEGHVRVERQTPGSRQDTLSVVDLRAGQALEGNSMDNDEAGIGTVTEVAQASVGQWRNGRISFNQTPLGQAIAEFERYGNTGLVVRDPAVAAMPVGGSYDLSQSKRFAEFVQQLLPVRLVQRDGFVEIVAR
jgi:transmembrane sensor